jgi:hypothetical protein
MENTMSSLQLRRFLPGQFDLLQRALDQATSALAKDEWTPAIKACLAEKLLTLAASGEGDPTRLGDAALAAMRACLANCQGCRPEMTPSSLAPGALPSRLSSEN